MSSFNNYESGFANVSCKDTADLRVANKTP